ncbi:MAG: hypothetical protein QNJ19_03385 [Woeseiaceae bacterium]|nr:hypothetical protein [Woeseiaceae bacterium]
MKIRKLQVGIAALLCLMAMPAIVTATVVRHMNLDALMENAGTIFRGTVIGIEVGTVEAGGAELPTTTYAFRVLEMFKGEATAIKGDEVFMTITMIGSPKGVQNGADFVRFNVLRDMPKLEQGAEYLLFTTPESDIGLSVTVGVGQGLFDLEGGMAINQSHNARLLEGTSMGGPAVGPIDYREMADYIRSKVGTP